MFFALLLCGRVHDLYERFVHKLGVAPLFHKLIALIIQRIDDKPMLVIVHFYHTFFFHNDLPFRMIARLLTLGIQIAVYALVYVAGGFADDAEYAALLTNIKRG